MGPAGWNRLTFGQFEIVATTFELRFQFGGFLF
jgi:hypothetical protein